MRSRSRSQMSSLRGLMLLVAVQIACVLAIAVSSEANGPLIGRDGGNCSEMERSVFTCEEPSTCIRTVNGVFTCCTGVSGCTDPKISCVPREKPGINKREGANGMSRVQGVCVGCASKAKRTKGADTSSATLTKLLRAEPTVWPTFDSIPAVTGVPVQPSAPPGGSEHVTASQLQSQPSSATLPGTSLTTSVLQVVGGSGVTCIVTPRITVNFVHTSSTSATSSSEPSPPPRALNTQHPVASEISGGAVGGITIGILIALGLLALILYLLHKRHSKRLNVNTSSTSGPELLSGLGTESSNRNSNLINSHDSTLVQSYQGSTDAALSPHDPRRHSMPLPGADYMAHPSTPIKRNAASPIGNGDGNMPKTPPLFSLYPQPRPIPSPTRESPSKRHSTNSTLNWPNSATSPTVPINHSNLLGIAVQQPFASTNVAVQPPTRSDTGKKKLRPRNEFAVGRRPQGMNVFDFIMADNAEQRRLERARQMEEQAEAEFVENETGTVRRKTKL